jgi:DNA-binding MarR family transcriptional regulator
VTLNISEALSSALARPARSARAARRQRLADAVVAEITSWNPREFIGMFKRMHKGSLSLIHLNVLIELEAYGPMSMGRLAEVLEVSVASATGIVDRMEKRGFLERRHDEHDRRVVIVHPTPAAADVFTSIEQARREGLTKLLANLTDHELAGLLAGHRALRKARNAMAAAMAEAANTAQATGSGDGSGDDTTAAEDATTETPAGGSTIPAADQRAGRRR